MKWNGSDQYGTLQFRSLRPPTHFFLFVSIGLYFVFVIVVIGIAISFVFIALPRAIFIVVFIVQSLLFIKYQDHCSMLTSTPRRNVANAVAGFSLLVPVAVAAAAMLLLLFIFELYLRVVVEYKFSLYVAYCWLKEW